MANNKVVFGEEVLIDLTQDTVTPYALEEGYTAHAPSGEKIVGVMKPNKPVEVATNAEMTAISTGATEKDLGKVYLFVGEDDGVFEKDALYILVKKGTGYGFQRYAIGGSGEAGEDLTAVLDEQSQLIAELKEKLANGGGSSGGSQECDCIIDVTELPKSTEVWLVAEGQAANFAELTASMGFLTTFYAVDELPDAMEPTSETSGYHVYIVNGTGVGYVTMDGTSSSAISLGYMTFDTSEADRGWIDDIDTIDPTDETQTGIYCVRGEPIDENSVYRVTSLAPILYVVNDGQYISLGDMYAQMGRAITVTYELVDDVPTSIPLIDIDDGSLQVCIVKSTGIAYVSDQSPENVVPMSKGFAVFELADKGWTDNISGETEAGWYAAMDGTIVTFHTFSDGVWSNYTDGLSLMNEIKELNGEIEGLNAEIEGLNAEIETFENNIATLTTEKESLTIANETLTTEKEALEVEVAEKVASANFTDYAVLRGSSNGVIFDSLTDKSINSLKIMDGIYSVNQYAMSHCENLENVVLPDSITDLGGYNGGVFIACCKLSTVVLPKSITQIQQRTFEGCWALISVTIPDTVTSIKTYAFAFCSSLAEIVYKGTKEQWKAIVKGNNLDDGAGNYIIYCTDGTIAKDGTET